MGCMCAQTHTHACTHAHASLVYYSCFNFQLHSFLLRKANTKPCFLKPFNSSPNLTSHWFSISASFQDLLELAVICHFGYLFGLVTFFPSSCIRGFFQRFLSFQKTNPLLCFMRQIATPNHRQVGTCAGLNHYLGVFNPFSPSSTIYFRKTSKLPIDLCVLSSLASIPERFFSFILNSLLSSEL